MQVWRRQGRNAETQRPRECSASLREQVLYPALQPLLQDMSWARWDATLSRMAYSTEAMDAFLGSHQAWRTRVDAKRVLRAEERRTADAAAATKLGASPDRGGEHERGHRCQPGQTHAHLSIRTLESK